MFLLVSASLRFFIMLPRPRSVHLELVSCTWAGNFAKVLYRNHHFVARPVLFFGEFLHHHDIHVGAA